MIRALKGKKEEEEKIENERKTKQRQTGQSVLTGTL
jgi:hypothetical protein